MDLQTAVAKGNRAMKDELGKLMEGVLKAVDNLPSKERNSHQKEVVEARYRWCPLREGKYPLPHDEVAKELGISSGSSRQALRSAKQKILKEVGDDKLSGHFDALMRMAFIYQYNVMKDELRKFMEGVLKAVDNLPSGGTGTHQKEVVEAMYQWSPSQESDYPLAHAEVAKKLGITDGSARHALHSAKEKIMKELEDDNPIGNFNALMQHFDALMHMTYSYKYISQLSPSQESDYPLPHDELAKKLDNTKSALEQALSSAREKILKEVEDDKATGHFNALMQHFDTLIHVIFSYKEKYIEMWNEWMADLENFNKRSP